MEVIQAAYPSFYRGQTAKQANIAIGLWFDCLRDYPAGIVYDALKSAIIKNPKFPPSIGDVNAEIVAMRRPDANPDIDGEKAWSSVLLYIRKYGEYSDNPQAGIELRNLMSDEAWERAFRAVGGFYDIRRAESDNIGTMRAQFIRIYNSFAKTRADNAILPPSLYARIESVKSENMAKLTDNRPTRRLLADSPIPQPKQTEDKSEVIIAFEKARAAIIDSLSDSEARKQAERTKRERKRSDEIAAKRAALAALAEW